MSKSLTFGLIIGMFLVFGMTGDSQAQNPAANRHPIAGMDSPLEFRHIPWAVDTISQDVPEIPTAANGALDWAKLTFQSMRNDNWEIYLADGYGGNQIRLTAVEKSDADPAINRGCTRLAFDSYRTNNWEIYTMNLDGSGLIQLTSASGSDWNPAWSPDNTQIAFDSYRNGSSDVFIMNADGSNQTRLVTDHGGFDGMPAWSPDGQKIAFVSDRSGPYKIHQMDKNGGNIQLFININNSMHPTWSPDGSWLGFDADYDGDGFQELWVANTNTQSAYIVFDPAGQTDAWARSWSPDGRFLAFTLISWVWQDNDWWWTTAYLKAWDSQKQLDNIIALSANEMDWHPTWASCDAVKPTSAVQALPAESPSPVVVKWSGSDQGSGIHSYDIQYREGTDGTWTTWITGTQTTSAELLALGGETLYFRSRALDDGGNREDWPAAPDAWTKIESLPPVTAMYQLPEYLAAKDPVEISWSGFDPGRSGILDYTVQVRQGPGGTWADWQVNTTATGADFTGVAGEIYYFRVRGRDKALNVESWHSDGGDTFTTFYDSLITGKMLDNRDSPVSGASLKLNPNEIASITSDFDGAYATLLKNGPAYDYSIQHSNFGSLPATNMGDTSNLAIALYDFNLPPIDDVVKNGHFEAGGMSNWQISGIYTATAYTQKRHTGKSSALVGPRSIRLNPEAQNVYWPEAVTDQAGALSILWGNVEWGTEKIYYIRRDSAGNWSALLQIGEADHGNAGTFPAHLAAEPNGIVHAIWVSGGRVVYRQRALNGTWSAPVQVSESGFIASMTSLGIDASGKAHVAWRDYSSPPETTRILYAQRAANGTWTNPVEISASTRNKDKPSIAVQPDGVVHVLWEEYEWKEGEFYVEYLYYARRATATGWSGPELISNGAGHSYNAVVGLDSSNTLHAAWWGDDGRDIYHAYRPAAGAWSAPVNVSNSPLTGSGYEDMAVEPGGDVHLIWIETNKIMYAHRVAGGSWSTPEIMSGGGFISTPGYPQVIVDAGGGVMLAWNEGFSGTQMAWKNPGGTWLPSSCISLEGGFTIPVLGINDRLHLIHSGYNTVSYTLLNNKNGQTVLSQSLEIPNNMSYPTLSFYYTLGGALTDLDTGLIVTLKEGQTTHQLLTQTVDSELWAHQWIDLSAWAGKNVTINFEARSAKGRPVVWLSLDEVTLGSSFSDLWLEPVNYREMLAGEQFEYHLQYGNQSSVIAQGTLITQTLPTGLVLISSDPAPVKILANQVVWDIGALAQTQPSQAITITLQVATDAAFGHIFTATYDIAGELPEPEAENNSGVLLIWVGRHVYLPLISR